MFINIVLDESVSWGATGGPMYNTTGVIGNNGNKQSNINWDIPLSRWSLSQVMPDHQAQIYFNSFWRTVKGKGHSWLFKDWNDYRVLASGSYGLTYDQGVFEALGSDIYQLAKRYYNGITDDIRPIFRLKPGVFTLYNGVTALTEGVNYTLDDLTGKLTIIGGATFTHWIGEFYFEAQFESDEPGFELQGPVTNWPRFGVMEVRDENL